MDLFKSCSPEVCQARPPVRRACVGPDKATLDPWPGNNEKEVLKHPWKMRFVAALVSAYRLYKRLANVPCRYQMYVCNDGTSSHDSREVSRQALSKLRPFRKVTDEKRPLVTHNGLAGMARQSSMNGASYSAAPILYFLAKVWLGGFTVHMCRRPVSHMHG